MTRLNKIRELDNEVFEQFKIYLPKLYESKFQNEHPITFQLFIDFDISTNFIKNSMFTCGEKDEMFGIKILFRSQIEYFLRFKYLFINWVKYQSDDISKKYIQFLNAKELIDYAKAVHSNFQLDNSTLKEIDWKKLLDKFPKLKNYSKQEIELEAAKFSYKNIIRFINNEVFANKSTQNSFLGLLIVEYAELSSYVHGGIKSFENLDKYTDESIRKQEYIRIASIAYQICTSIKMFILTPTLKSEKEEFAPYYHNINSLLNKIEEID